jgi:two-component system, OmpR family, response regulator
MFMPSSSVNRSTARTRPSPAGRVLIADDDESSRCFLADALRALGWQVVRCPDGRRAIALAAAEYFDLLLLDCRMPHAGALDVLAALRNDTQARSSLSPAVATSAEITPSIKASLLAAGFADVLEKPCKMADLQAIVVHASMIRHPLPVLDDDAALACSGDPDITLALRELLHDELVQLLGELGALTADRAKLDERLHRLRSACGFCGASRLAAQTQALQRMLRQSADVSLVASLTAFETELYATIGALAPVAREIPDMKASSAGDQRFVMAPESTRQARN